MKNNVQEEINKFNLFVNYNSNKTLAENLEGFGDIKTDINEQPAAGMNLIKNVVKRTAGALEPVFDDIFRFSMNRGKSEIKVLDNTVPGGVRAATSGKDIMTAIENGLIKSTDDMLRINKGMFKATGVDPAILKELSSDIVLNPNFIKEYGQYAGNMVQLKRALVQKGYSQQGADALVQQIKVIKKAKMPWGTVTPKQKPPIPPGTNPAGKLSMTQKIKDKWATLSKKLKRRWLIGLGLTAATAVGGAAVLGRSVFGGTTSPDETGLVPFPKCVNDLLESDGASVAATTGGDPVIIVTNTGNPAYDQIGGLKFYTNGRVFSGDASKRGRWSCNGSQANLQEIFNNILSEQEIDAQLNNDAETMVDLLDFPVSERNLMDAMNLLKKYVGNPKGKQFLSTYANTGLGGGSLQKTLDYVVTTGANSGQAKNIMKGMVQKIESGASAQPTAGGGQSLGIGGVTIVWDGESQGGTTPTPTPTPKKKSIYHDCTEFPFVKGCRNAAIKEVQTCLKFPAKYQTGNFGPITEKGLTDNGYSITAGLTKQIYDAIKAKCGQNETPATPAHIPGSEFQDSNIPPTNIPDANRDVNKAAELPIA